MRLYRYLNYIAPKFIAAFDCSCKHSYRYQNIAYSHLYHGDDIFIYNDLPDLNGD